jgi:hypothetical protein
VNHGKPAIAATSKPGQFAGPGVQAAKAAGPAYKPAAERSATRAGKTVAAEKGATMARPNATQNSVPRPPSSSSPSILPGQTAARNVPHPPSASENPTSPGKPSAAHPQGTLHASNNSIAHSGAAPNNAPHSSSAPHVNSSPHPQATPRSKKQQEEHGKRAEPSK